MTILFVDRINFHQANFPELFNVINQENLDYIFNEYGNKGLKKSFGNYEKGHHSIYPYYEKLKKLDTNDLFEYQIYNINLFKIAKYELLQKIISKREWYNAKTKNNNIDLYRKLLMNNYEDLLLNLSAANFWIEYWFSFYKKNKQIRYVLTFGNSQIYALAASKLASCFNITPYILEHLFTGIHYFLEARKSPIQGQPYSADIYKNDEKISNEQCAIIKSLISNTYNKNVKQPSFRLKNLFNNNKKTILIIAQVVNDISLLIDKHEYIGSIAIYKEIIKYIIYSTECNIIIKTHPYEKCKHPDKKNITYDEIYLFIKSFTKTEQCRIIVIDNYDINSLILNIDCGFTICSQAGLELLYNNIPVVTLSSSFYSMKGFTKDYVNINDFIYDIKNNNVFHFSSTEKYLFYVFCKNLFENCISPMTAYNDLKLYFCSARKRINQQNYSNKESVSPSTKLVKANQQNYSNKESVSPSTKLVKANQLKSNLIKIIEKVLRK